MSSTVSHIEGPADAELISAVRGGDVDAYGELFARHVDAARRLARHLTSSSDAEDLVSDAFAKVLTVLQRGGGPDLAFRAYLLTAVRRLHVDRIRAGSRLRPVEDLTPFDPGVPFRDTAVEGFENDAAARAFATLPERWQMVLWHMEVERQKPADIAPLLGMSANSVSALAYRAREGLRQAFLNEHAGELTDVDCAWTREHLGASVRGGLAKRDQVRVDEHLQDCRACAAVYLELLEVNSGLAGILAPMLLGSAGVGYLATVGAKGAGLLAGLKAWAGTHAVTAASVGATVTAAAAITAYTVVQAWSGPGTPHAQGDAGPVTTSSHSSSHGTRQPGRVTDHHGGKHGGKSSGGTSDPLTSEPPAVTPTTSSTDSTTSPTTGPTDPTTTPTTGPTDPGTSNPTSAPTTDPTTDPTTAPTTGPTTAPTQGTLTFTSTPPANPKIGSTYRVSATGGSPGDPIKFTIDPLTTHQACTISNATVAFTHAGRCVIDAAQKGDNSSFARAFHVRQRVWVPKMAQAITFTSKSPPSPTFGETYEVSAVGGGSGNPVVFSPTTPNVCGVSGTTVTFQHAGDCTVAAHQDGNADYKAADAAQPVLVPRAVQTIDFGSSPPDDAVVGGPAYTVAAKASSGDPVTFTIGPSTTNDACALSATGSSVTFQHAGTCTIEAQAGNSDYQAATAHQTFAVGKGTQSVNFTSQPPSSPAFGDTYTPTATSGSGETVSFSIDSSTTTNNACALTGPNVLFEHAGDCTVNADQAGTSDYEPAKTIQQTVVVPKAAQTIAFPAIPAAAAHVGASYALTATTDAPGLDVSYTSATKDVCDVTGSTLTFQHAGDCTINANQGGNDDYFAASTATRSVAVARGAQSITFPTIPGSAAHVGATYALTATTDAPGLDVSYTSATKDVCDVTGSTLTFQHAGDCTINADQAGTTDYEPAKTIQQTVVVPKTAQSVTFTSTPPSPAYVLTSSALAATGGQSGNPVVFSSDTPAVCSVKDVTVSFQKSGTCTVRADQAGSRDYEAASTTQDVTVTHRDLTLTATQVTFLGIFHRVEVNVTGLDPGASAQLSVQGSGLTFIGVGETGCSNGSRTLTCTVTSTPATFVFPVLGLPSPDSQLTFTISSATSGDSDPTNNTVKLALED